MAAEQRADSDVPIKKRKLSVEEDAINDQNDLKSLSGFKVCKIIKENTQHKVAVVHGKFENSDDDAVVIVEKTPFSSGALQNILSSQTELKLNITNDIYRTYDAFPKAYLNGIKTTLIYPATKKHIDKYTDQDVFMVHEKAEDYNNITLPYLNAESFSIQWVYNILEKKTEADRIVFEDADPETGFILLPDMKWDCKQVEDLYLVALVHKHGIKSLRDLNEQHLPLLKNILHKGKSAIMEKYNIPPNKLRVYIHYQPSYYHLHIHFTHLKHQAPGTDVGRAHLLQDVIDNIELDGAYYQKKTLSYVVRKNDKLYTLFEKAGIL